LTREDKFAKEGLTFDDVLLIPARSDILPTQVSTETRLTNEIRLDVPILSAAMDTVTDARLAIALGRLGGLGVIHRNLTVVEQAEEVRRAKDADVLVGAAVGVAGDADERAAALVGAGADVIVVDTAHGHSAAVVRMVEKVKARHRVEVIAGNVATAEGTEELIAAGADCVKVGMGPGAICTTRIVAGAGMPQITAIFDCAEAADRHGIPVCADGGIQHSGDIAKAIGAGAWTVMLGGLLAGVDEAPGDVVETDEGSYKSSARWKLAARAIAMVRPTLASSRSWFPKGSRAAFAPSVHSRPSCTSSSAVFVRVWATRARPRSTICE